MNEQTLTTKVENAKRYQALEYSRRKLDKIINTRITAAFIGAIAAFEDDFGFLWGHGLSEAQKTDEQQSMSEVWAKVRSRVLNNGNNQVRLASTEVTRYIAGLNRDTIRFIVDKE